MMPDNPRIHKSHYKDNPAQEKAIQEILRRVEEEVRQKYNITDLTLDKIEEQSQNIGEEVKRIIEEEGLQSVGTGQSAMG